MLEGLDPSRFGAAIADPPWAFLTRSAKGQKKSASMHYPVMSIAQIKALPVRAVMAKDAAVFMWTTAPHLALAIDILAAWGFTFKTAGAWAKRSRRDRSWQFGTGYIHRSAAEFWLVGTVGRPKRQSRRETNLIVAPVREHSVKPQALHAKVEALYAGPYLELFARRLVPGWTTWGNEAPLMTAAAEAA